MEKLILARTPIFFSACALHKHTLRAANPDPFLIFLLAPTTGKLNEPSVKPKLLLSAFPPEMQNFQRTKSSSTSTLFLNTTIKAPNNDEIIRWYVIWTNSLHLKPKMTYQSTATRWPRTTRRDVFSLTASPRRYFGTRFVFYTLFAVKPLFGVFTRPEFAHVWTLQPFDAFNGSVPLTQEFAPLFLNCARFFGRFGPKWRNYILAIFHDRVLKW